MCGHHASRSIRPSHRARPCYCGFKAGRHMHFRLQLEGAVSNSQTVLFILYCFSSHKGRISSTVLVLVPDEDPTGSQDFCPAFPNAIDSAIW
ncbi:hypothetical protein M378DRAFT_621921 [Amanita muscaria Koide BX008]|uniref:Uncharacterized protein n=1 Tax=Amanita muscaria (strain Koide BX008) TaxID=946122 RepID=A0A0C2XLK5_AMAMK|nr:hypothetical protein M378DRAFT_621921 [Amanita muscaria Koide BX008]